MLDKVANAQNNIDLLDEYDVALEELDAAKHKWTQKSIEERIQLLSHVKDGIMAVAEGWAHTSARKKGLVPGTPISGEEWIAGPYAAMAAVNSLISTLSQMEGKSFIDHLLKRQLATGQLGIKVLPHSIWDRLLLSGISAEVWMKKGITTDNLKEHTAIAYDIPLNERKGKVALVLGAGNIAAISPLDVLQKLILENQVVILKMNPINEYLTDFFKIAMKPLIDADALRIVKGDGTAGAYLCEHPIVEELHITGSDATHDVIVWGAGKEGEKNRKAGKPKNLKRFTSELGSVSPTIVVPGPWSAADLRFQAENLATMKLHNSGHNCIALQALIMPKGWDKGPKLLEEFKKVVSQSTRPTWYTGANERMQNYEANGGKVEKIDRGDVASPLFIGEISEDSYNRECEVFGPALGIKEFDAPNAETYLRSAIEYANKELWGTLGANILVHPKTIRQIGKKRFEEILADLEYGTIAINGWSGLGFLIAACPWGAYPGHTLEDIQSGVGTVHNTFMLEETERVVVRAPWRPFPRGLLSLQFSLLPRPPFFVTNKKQHKIGELLTKFQYKPSFFKLPRIFLNALLG